MGDPHLPEPAAFQDYAGTPVLNRKVKSCLVEQDRLTLLVTQSAEASRARITGSIVEFLPIGDGAATLARLADPAIRIVSLTVTEGGYLLEPDGRFDPGHPSIRADADAPDQPKTVFGLLLKAGSLSCLRGLEDDAGLAGTMLPADETVASKGRIPERTLARSCMERAYGSCGVRPAPPTHRSGPVVPRPPRPTLPSSRQR